MKIDSRTRIVTYYIDEIDNSGCYYDIPWRIVYFYDFEKNEWIKKITKYRNSKKIAKKQGSCLGGDYGIMKIERYKKENITFSQINQKDFDKSMRLNLYCKMIKNIIDETGHLVKKMNRCGNLIISVGDFRSDYNKEDHKVHYSMFRGLCFTPKLDINNYPSESFVWTTKKD
jgi:hypothetical protein